MKKPTFFIVGAPKCGTTAMAQYLRAHPDVFFPKTKEPHFFSDDITHLTRAETIQEYLRHFEDWTEEAVAGEASVFYLYSESATTRIGQFSPNSKIVIMLRNPIEMLHSLYYHLLYTGDEDLLTFEEALDAEQDRMAGRRIPTSSHVPRALQYCANASYTEHVRRYLRHFGEDRVHVVIYDDFKQNTTESYQAVLRFLGVDSNFKTELPVVNASKEVRYPVIAPILRNPPGWLIRAGRAIIPKSIRRTLREDLQRLNSRRMTRKPMAKDTREQLSRRFAPEVENLSKLLDRDLTPWLDGP